jgi:predicted lipoprotein with Yx(FWY)xxD motif
MKQMKTPHKRFGAGAPLALGVSAAIVLAACGSSTAKVSPAAPPPAATSTTSPGASSAPVVLTAKSSKLGSILVDAKGMTLYTLTNAGKPVACTDQCATFWPPLVLPPGAVTAMGGSGVTGLGTTSVMTVVQVTEHGLPLYRFSKDTAPGDTNGEGISSFGGTWHVATMATKTAANPPAAVPPATPAPAAAPPATMPPATMPPVTSPPATSPATPGGYY